MSQAALKQLTEDETLIMASMGRQLNSIINSISLGVIAFSTAARAQNVYDLEPVVSVAPPVLEKSAIESRGKIDSLSREVLDNLHATDLTSALRRVPGVTISRYNPVGAYGGSDGGGVFIRGHGTARPGSEISTMIDGVPLFVGVWTHPLIDTLSVDMAESIEVFKSPQSALMGSMGFGAINLKPLSANDLGFKSRYELSYGSHETSLAKGLWAYGHEDFSTLLSFSHRQSEGHRENADGEVQAIYGNFAWKLSEAWDASFMVSLTDSHANDPEPIGISIPITERYETSNRFYLGKLSYTGDDSEFFLKIHLEDGEGDWRQWHQPPPPPFPAQQLDTLTSYNNYGVKTKWSRRFSERTTLSGGVDWDRFGGEVDENYAAGPRNQFDSQHFEILAPHVWLSHLLLESDDSGKLILDLGSRYMQHSVFDSEIALQSILRWEIDGASYYAQYSRGSNYPGVYVSVFGRRPPPWQVAEDWRNLEPEQIDHFELGAQWELGSQTTLNLSVFEDKVENAIRFIAPPPAGFIQNFGDYSIQGLESMVHHKVEDWTLFAGATVLDGDEGLPALPELSGTLGFNWMRNGWLFSMDYQYVDDQLTTNPRFGAGPQLIEAYSLVSAQLSYRWTASSVDWEAYLHAENLLDETYEYRKGYPMPGASFFFGLKWSL
ncbi:MAG: TonB-dependent receptor plug domain-containing protein [Opitutales bacterium]|nr:TonB-dependent receptor plug domain-containing protein [Opitutales bacterium]